MGASFDHGEDGNLHLAREGGHSHRRIVHAADMTGREIERALLEAVVRDPNIFVLQHHFAIDLLTSEVCFCLLFLLILAIVSKKNVRNLDIRVISKYKSNALEFSNMK